LGCDLSEEVLNTFGVTGAHFADVYLQVFQLLLQLLPSQSSEYAS
jgi:hypothetical protein